MENVEQHLPVGSRVDRYRIERVLGIGGFGVTYLATDTELEYPVALKEFMPDDCAVRSQSNSQILAKTNRQDDYQYGLDRFLDEAKTLAKFKHPNIVRVANFLKFNNTAYLVMDYEEGEALDAKIKRIKFTGQMAEVDILAILKPILKGLEKVHSQGLLHRDIKPGNIYLRQDGEPMLIDFGAARYALGSQSKSISAIISMGYAPPEQYSSQGKQGVYSDLYALGATVYELMSGKPPAESPVRREATVEGEPDPMTSAASLVGGYSQNLCAVVDWCLRLSGKQRPQTASEVLTALDAGMPLPEGEEAAKAETTDSGTRRVKQGEHFGKQAKPSSSAKNENITKPGFAWVPLAIAGLVVAAGGAYWWLPAGESPDPGPSSNIPVGINKPAAAKSLPVTIRANVAAVKIYIDGQGYYQPGQKLAAANYTLVAEAEGYQSLRQQITVGPDSTFFNLQLELLTPVLYPLSIVTTPTDAAIQVLNIGPKYQQGMVLAAGEYRIKASKPGYSSKTLNIKLSAQQQRFNINLKRQKLSERIGHSFQDNLSRGGKGPELVVLPRGHFQMGCMSVQGCGDAEKPVHAVNINHGIAMMKTEVTFSDYDKFSDATGRSRVKDEGWGRGSRPVINVSWNDAVAYAKWLSQQAGKVYRLPSEAEWEYAARADSQAKYSWGNDIDCSKAQYNGGENSRCYYYPNGNYRGTAEVGRYAANKFGLYDLHGNVWEWVADCWHGNYNDAPGNGKVWIGDDCELRVLRGGSWYANPHFLRSANRFWDAAGNRNRRNGFRLVQDLNP